ncbi:putative aarF domain-containing protein kinase 1 [Ananas comosus]|uniref:Putative aarF domain-containing protein kinase 1 n=1 Tax=Ananas comosus TaxID=4615 RepID=A0A199W2B8_ANACO|nr:putative aarF domain-containing protein kinase 1 [Ananas comosus]
MGWGNTLQRRMRVFAVALVIYLDYKAVQKRVKWVSRVKKNTIWEKTHQRNAKRVLNLMIELEGLWVKLGQYLSTRADVLPEAYISLLKKLQDSLPPRPLKEVCRTIERELGESMRDLFSNFVHVPLATASIAQVHRATTKDGQEVVVKVQHEGIKEIILEDLKNAKSIVDWIAWAEPQYNFSPIIDEWCKEAPKELDFNHEAENTRTVSKNLQPKNEGDDLSNSVDVIIPEVIQSSEKVLVLQYMDGIRLNDNESLEAYGVDKQRLVEEITRAYAHQIYVDGFFNGDPHPGNFLVSKEPPHRPILLDFGLTKSISSSMKRALAKMFLACAEGDHVALLSAFAEMGLKLRLDMPQQAMDITAVFFRTSTPANEALENIKSLADQREKNMRAIQEKMKLNKEEVRRFNPVDAFPGDAIIFSRVLNLLRGLSATLNVRIAYLDIMKPFAESTLRGITNGQMINTQWIYDSPIHSEVEAKLRQHLVELGSEKILGIQVCAYKDGKVIIDTAAGVLGKYDPRPVQHDSLFPVFSVTKGITAGLVHWLVDKGKLNLEETIASIWPNFGNRKKELIKVHHVLNHASGLHNAMADVMKEDPLVMCDWEESLSRIERSVPETEPGSSQFYHYLSFGWLCGGVIEHASGKKFQEVLEEAIVRPLNIEGELYIGIPPGVESRLATLTIDAEDLQKLSVIGTAALTVDREDLLKLSANGARPGMLTTLVEGNLAQVATGLPVLFNTLNIRRAIIPAANGHCSARALARYYAALATGGSIPPPHSPNSNPPLGSHTHIPKFPTFQPKKKRATKDATDDLNTHGNTNEVANGNGYNNNKGYSLVDIDEDEATRNGSKLFTNPKIHDALMGVGDYANLVIPNGKFGLGFRRFSTASGKLTSFGHSGIGGSTGFCDVEHDFSIAVTVNKMSLGGVTRSIIQLVCAELNIPLPDEFSTFGEKGPDMQLNLGPQAM